MLSAAGVALGLVAERVVHAIRAVILPLALFLGLATFARVVEIQREATIYITGMNDPALYRSQGTGMRRRPPRYGLALALVQTQGIVGVVCAYSRPPSGALPAWRPARWWSVAGATFAITLVTLIVSWRRSFDALRKAIRPINPTQPDEIEAPFSRQSGYVTRRTRLPISAVWARATSP